MERKGKGGLMDGERGWKEQRERCKKRRAWGIRRGKEDMKENREWERRGAKRRRGRK